MPEVWPYRRAFVHEVSCRRRTPSTAFKLTQPHEPKGCTSAAPTSRSRPCELKASRLELLTGPATLSPFLVAKYEVSQAEWKRVMVNNPSRSKGDALPVEQVAWEDCQEFCRKTGLSLPTEAQWEYACRAGKAGPFAGTGELDEMEWSKENSGVRAHEVGEKPPNDFPKTFGISPP